MHTVALLLHEHAMLYEAAIAIEVFGVDRSDLSPDGRWYELVACAPDGAGPWWLPGVATGDLSALASADTVLVPSTSAPEVDPPPVVAAALGAARDRGSRIASLCTGAFVLAAAGLLDDHTATTHWMHAARLAARYPRVRVRPDVLYIDEGQLLTSAGKTAALDLCLHLVRKDFGTTVANGLARRLVTAAHRPGGQAQFIAAPAAAHDPDGLGAALDWARASLDQPLTVEALAGRAGLSSRQLARRMKSEIGLGPLQWLHHQRVTRAQELLEGTDASIEQIASRCGMGTAATLRRHFQRAVGVSPTSYRTLFRT